MSDAATCAVCGDPMPEGEQMFKFHGYSGPCPKPPLPKPAAAVPVLEVRARAVVAAWERFGQCLAEFGGESAHLCSEYDDALDDAIIGLRKELQSA